VTATECVEAFSSAIGSVTSIQENGGQDRDPREMQRLAPLIDGAVYAGSRTREIPELNVNEIAIRARPGDAAADLLLDLNTADKRAVALRLDAILTFASKSRFVSPVCQSRW